MEVRGEEKEGRVEILFFAVFVKASLQDEHGVKRPTLSQGCGGGVAPTSSLSSLLYLSYLLSLLSLLNPMRRFVTFSKKISIFRLLKTFLSYQQVINNAFFLTRFWGKSSVKRRIFSGFV